MMVSEILEQDHGQLSELLRELELSLRQDDPGHSFALLDLFWARLAMHIRAENLYLFPAILNTPRKLFYDRSDLPSFEEAETKVESLRSDHNFFMDELSKAVKTFREILAKDERGENLAESLDTITERVKAVSQRLQSHNVLEEDQVYKWAALILSASDLLDLGTALRRELENLPPRFRAR
jgi:iron-sulfur cluster repair protein YtfE (RIC family)